MVDRRFPVDDEHQQLARMYEKLRMEHLSQPGRRSVTAIHVPAAVYLHQRLTQLDPLSVVDLGSGFSTVVIRAWARATGSDAVLHTTDHARKWLGSTARDLREAGLPNDNMFLHDEWTDGKVGLDMYDVVFVDFHGPPQRVAGFEAYMDRVHPDGLVIFDDWQFPHLREPIMERLADRGFVWYDLRTETRDVHDRWMAEAHRYV